MRRNGHFPWRIFAFPAGSRNWSVASVKPTVHYPSGKPRVDISDENGCWPNVFWVFRSYNVKSRKLGERGIRKNSYISRNTPVDLQCLGFARQVGMPKYRSRSIFQKIATVCRSGVSTWRYWLFRRGIFFWFRGTTQKWWIYINTDQLWIFGLHSRNL